MNKSANEFLKELGCKNPPLDIGIGGGVVDKPRVRVSNVMEAYQKHGEREHVLTVVELTGRLKYSQQRLDEATELLKRAQELIEADEQEKGRLKLDNKGLALKCNTLLEENELFRKALELQGKNL